jgi:hypothetical protein
MRRPPTLIAWMLVATVGWGCASPDEVVASGPPVCEDIEAFAAQLVDVGITYDYEPTVGPAELAGLVDLVVQGELTGEVVHKRAASSADDPHVGYEVALGEVLVGEVADGSDSVVVSVPYNPHHADAGAYAAAAAPGVPIIVFAHVAPHAPGGLLAAAMEGFLTGCDGDEPIGFVGHLGEWSVMTSLRDVAAAVSAGQE